jgi:hypothetical protein
VARGTPDGSPPSCSRYATAAIPFIRPALASRLQDHRLLEDARYAAAEPKLDGQPAQLHIEAGRIIACGEMTSRGIELIARENLDVLQPSSRGRTFQK